MQFHNPSEELADVVTRPVLAAFCDKPFPQARLSDLCKHPPGFCEDYLIKDEVADAAAPAFAAAAEAAGCNYCVTQGDEDMAANPFSSFHAVCEAAVAFAALFE